MKLPYGYFVDADFKISINEGEANIVKLIFQSYLEGSSLGGIADMLSDKRITSPSGKDTWSRAAIDRILSNKKYFPHIITIEQYFDVQFEKTNRSNMDYDTGNRKATRYNSQSVLSGLLICAECGAHYRRITPARGEVVWRCANRAEHGSRICHGSPSIPESEVKDYLCKLLDMNDFDPRAVKNQVESILIENDGSMTPDLTEQSLSMQML